MRAKEPKKVCDRNPNDFGVIMITSPHTVPSLSPREARLYRQCMTKITKLSVAGCALRYTLLAVLLGACAGDSTVASPTAPPRTPTPPPTTPTPAGPVGPFVVGSAYLDAQGWVQFTAGDAPLVIIAPHGGLLTPLELPDRTCAGCVTVNDANTQQLARVIVDTFAARTGRRPHLVVNLLHRRKFDGNRDLAEASGGNTAVLGAPWGWMHAAVDSAKADVARRWQRGLVIDLHGHAHAIARLELGYLLTATQLRLDDATLLASGALSTSSIAQLLQTGVSTQTPTARLRGATSLGGLLEARGFASVPSPSAPAPQMGEEYFNGGFNTAQHGSRSASNTDAVQIECHFTGVRDTEASRAAFASALVDALLVLFANEYGWQP